MHGDEGVRAGREDERERQRDVGQRERVRAAPELQLDRPALGDEHHEAERPHQAISGPWIGVERGGSRGRTARRRAAPMTAFSHHTGSIERASALRECHLRYIGTASAIPGHASDSRPCVARRRGQSSAYCAPASTGPWSSCALRPRAPCVQRALASTCALVQLARVGSTPASTSACSTSVVRPQALVGAGARVGRQRARRRPARRRRDGRRGAGRAVRGGDRVVDQRDGAVARERPAVQRDAVVHRDRRQRQDVAGEAVVVPSVAELPTCQNTLQACAPLTSLTRLADAVISVEPAWKTKTAFGSPWASSVSVAGQPERRRGLVDAGRERAPAEVRGRRRRPACARRRRHRRS